MLPAVTHLASRSDYSAVPDFERRAHRVRTLATCAPSLEFAVLHEDFALATDAVLNSVFDLHSLKHISVRALPNARDGSKLRFLVSLLPRSLAELDIAAPPFMARAAEIVAAGIREGWGGLANLQVLSLPRERTMVLRVGEEPREVAGAVMRAAAAAQARGVRVEWV